MNPSTPRSNELAPQRNLLIVRSGYRSDPIRALADAFFGEVLVDPPARPTDLGDRQVYIAGDLSDFDTDGLHVIEDLSRGHTRGESVGVGQVPQSVHGLGVWFPQLFESAGFFDRIRTEHAFQQLTESTKPSQALRTGIYLSEVHEDGEDLRFHLMRCSSNLSGPTDNFRDADRQVLGELNRVAQHLFEREVRLNHVLAQIYRNRAEPDAKPKKARIGAHSDKTKDMHADGVMAFCTFYDETELGRLERSKTDPYDRVHRNQSGMTRLHFRRKRTVEDDTLVESFAVTLYPNSVLFIPLSTNRLYTHEIRPSVLHPDHAPTRMGYVVRCSAQEAVFRDGQTHIREGDALVPLQPMGVDDARELRSSYREENCTNADVTYGRVHFSMNAGDYHKPIL